MMLEPSPVVTRMFTSGVSDVFNLEPTWADKLRGAGNSTRSSVLGELQMTRMLDLVKSLHYERDGLPLLSA